MTSASQDRSARRSSARSSRHAFLLVRGQRAADGTAQLGDPVLQGVEWFLHDSNFTRASRFSMQTPKFLVYGVRQVPLARRGVLFLMWGGLLMRLLHTSDWHLGRTVRQRSAR